MKLINIFILSAGLLLSYSLSAQHHAILRLDPVLDSLQTNTTAYNDSSISFGIKLYNDGDTLFGDTVSFAYAVSGGGFVNTGLTANCATSGLSFVPRPVQIGPHDSLLMYAIHPYYSYPYFVVGSSTIVIWPIAYHQPNVVIADSAKGTVYFWPAGVLEQNSDQAADNLKVYMSGGSLMVRCDSKNTLGDIRIFNTVGELISARKLDSQLAIPMEQYSSGLYLVEVVLSDGTRRIYKVPK